MNFINHRAIVLTIGICLMSLQAATANPKIHYQLSMSKPHTHLLEVDITFSNLNDDEHLDFILPVWRPGRYLVLDFAGGVQEFKAYKSDDRNDQNDKSKALRWEKIHKSIWRVETQGQHTVSVSYKVFANEFGLRTRGLNDEHAFVDGSSVFMYVEKYRRLPLTIDVHPFGDWHVTTGLDRKKKNENLFQAPNYDYLIDCPIEVGTQQDIEFEVEGKKHYLSIAGTGDWNTDKMIERLKKVVQANYEFWGDLPYERYIFMVHSTPHGGGGTEHINSTIMGMRQFGYHNDSDYQGFTNLAMHEFFHTWNVKQLRPAGIHPFDFLKENYSKSLWVSEGTTSYYTSILMRRAGFTSVPSFLRSLANRIENDRSRPGRRIQSLEESSFDAWVKFWKSSSNDQNSEVSYYGKGSDVSLILDLEIRHRTENRGSLDEVMRRMYKRFPLNGPGFTPEDLQNMVEEVGEGDYDEFFSKYVRGTDEIDYHKFLGYAGLEVVESPPSNPTPELGISTRQADGKVTVRSVKAGSPAYEAGLNDDDEIIALNGFRIGSTFQLTQHLKRFKEGDAIRLSFFRDDRLREIDIPLRYSEVPEFTVNRKDEAIELEKKIYADWLGAKWPGEE